MSSPATWSWWKGRYQNSCWAAGARIRSPMPGSGGVSTSARTKIRAVSGDGLRDPAADVVTAEDRPVQPEFFDQRDDTAGLRVGAVLDRRVARVFVGRAEAAQVWYHNVGRWQERGNVAVLGAVARPSVQQHHGETSSRPLVRKPEPINGGCSIHIGHGIQVGRIVNSARPGVQHQRTGDAS